jgi:hypothetical protein
MFTHCGTTEEDTPLQLNSKHIRMASEVLRLCHKFLRDTTQILDLDANSGPG